MGHKSSKQRSDTSEVPKAKKNTRQKDREGKKKHKKPHKKRDEPIEVDEEAHAAPVVDSSIDTPATNPSPQPSPATQVKKPSKKDIREERSPHITPRGQPTQQLMAHSSESTTLSESEDDESSVEEVYGASMTQSHSLADDIVQSMPKKVTKEDFEIQSVLGMGNFGKVMKVKHKETGEVYAMKVMKKEFIIAKAEVTHTKDEKSILEKMKHPFIVKLRFAFQSRDKLYLIMDYVEGGEIFFHLKREKKFTEERARFYIAEIGLALLHLHHQGILYRDLKPENILLSKEGHVVLTDFGLSTFVHQKGHRATSFCGSPQYLAPEMLRGSGHSYPVDFWSLGVLLYEMLVGLPPFYSPNAAALYRNILCTDPAFPAHLSSEANSLLAGLLRKQPSKRLYGDDFLNHPFFASMDWTALKGLRLKTPFKPPPHERHDDLPPNVEDGFKYMALNESDMATSPLFDLNDHDDFRGFTFDPTTFPSSLSTSTSVF